MGLTKRMLEEKEKYFNIAKSILIDIGAIGVCDVHDYYYNNDNYDNSDLYAIATNKYKEQGYTDFKMFRDAIKEVMDNAGIESTCPYCEKAFSE